MRRRPFSPARAVRGFTTVEMWTAAAVGLALLCCAAYGFVASAKNAEVGACMNNLHTIQTAMALYASDADGNLPPFAFDPVVSVPAHQGGFIAALKPEGLAPKAWICPADPHAGTSFKGLWYDYKRSSYAMPPSTLSAGKLQADGGFLMALPTDSTTILLLDQPFVKGKIRTTAHGRDANALFADGHVSRKPATSQF